MGGGLGWTTALPSGNAAVAVVALVEQCRTQRSGAGYVLWKLVAGRLRADTQRFPTDAPVVLLGFGRCGFIFFGCFVFVG